MLVGPHADTRDERKADAVLLPGVIGSIRITAGFDTLKFANGTPAQATVGDPRSRARSGGFGMLWLTALTFSLMKEVRAADPNVTFLDDGSITYKDLEHGAFELVTKEAVPRHILVEDPGQTIVLRPQGSSVSVNQVTNSPARMAELQEAQQEVLATATKGVGSTGSSTPPSDDSLQVQPINFIQNDSIQPGQNGLAPLPASFVTVPETIIGRLPPPAPTPPTFNALAGPIETDTVAFDLFTATTGTFAASAANGAALTFGIGGGTVGSTVVNGATFDVSQVGPFGTLFVNSATGAYTFVPDNDAINALTAPTVANFTVTVSDGTLSASQAFHDRHQRHQRRRRHFRRYKWLGDRGRRRRQCLIRPVDRYRQTHEHRRRQSAQHLHGGRFADAKQCRLRYLHHDGGWLVDLRARQHQPRGTGAQCR